MGSSQSYNHSFKNKHYTDEQIKKNINNLIAYSKANQNLDVATYSLNGIGDVSDVSDANKQNYNINGGYKKKNRYAKYHYNNQNNSSELASTELNNVKDFIVNELKINPNGQTGGGNDDINKEIDQLLNNFELNENELTQSFDILNQFKGGALSSSLSSISNSDKDSDTESSVDSVISGGNSDDDDIDMDEDEDEEEDDDEDEDEEDDEEEDDDEDDKKNKTHKKGKKESVTEDSIYSQTSSESGLQILPFYSSSDDSNQKHPYMVNRIKKW
jgi:hypothetical protein